MVEERSSEVAATLLALAGVVDPGVRAQALSQTLPELSEAMRYLREEARGHDPAFTFDAAWD